MAVVVLTTAIVAEMAGAGVVVVAEVDVVALTTVMVVAQMTLAFSSKNS